VRSKGIHSPDLPCLDVLSIMTLNKSLVAVALALIIFQIIFSIYYSINIINMNQQYANLSQKYEQLNIDNQNLEIEYASKFAINGQITP